jgi:broad specificity phosphatase PhoE
MRNRYYLMRHGESLANVADKIISLPANGLSGYGLSELGRQQASQSALASGLPADTVLVASDFLRTVQTAEVASQSLRCRPARLHPGLREREFGELEGCRGDDYRKVWVQDEVDPTHTMFGAESALALAERLTRVVQELEQEFHGRDVLLVSHGDPLRFLQLHANGRPLTEHLQVRLFAPAEIRALGDLPPVELE